MTDETTASPADDEAGAKTTAEAAAILAAAKEHLARVAALEIEAQAHADAMRLSREALAALVQTGTQELASVQAVAQTVTVAGEKVTTEQALIATKSAHIQDAQEHGDKVRAQVDKLLTAIEGHAAKTEGLQTRAEATVDAIATANKAASASKAAVDLDAAAVKESLTQAAAATKESRGLADRAAKVEQTLTAYEERLKELNAQSDEQLETIKALLPGATSAGLASAFDARAGTFTKPQHRWQWIFVGSLVGLILLGVTGIWHALTATAVLTYDELFRLWLTRLPVAGALLWLTLHAARESALAKRLEEDYGYKSAIASSFEGFNLQMSKVGESAPVGSPLERLCTDTLATIANPPGRIYDKHRLTVSPSHEVATLAAALIAAIKAESVTSSPIEKAAPSSAK
ncbi:MULTISPECIES: hypothetical protein [unclassified Luteibacter]|uniref:hypothetical protein n=1 Tax=Luteibacter sp. PvP019 TaxID=3156436 RepID=UPI003392B647